MDIMIIISMDDYDNNEFCGGFVGAIPLGHICHLNKYFD